MTQINPKYIALIDRVKEKHPELREIVEDLRDQCLIVTKHDIGVFAYQDPLSYFFFSKERKNVIWANKEDCKIIWQLDLYILSRALWWCHFIEKWVLYGLDKYNEPCDELLIFPHWNISEYPDELLEKIKNIL